MNKDEAIGGIILAGGLGLLVYVGYQAVKHGGLVNGILGSVFGTGPKGGTGTVFSGIAATLLGNDIASGGPGERLGATLANKSVTPDVPLAPGPNGLMYNTNFSPLSPTNPTGWDARYAVGYQSVAAKKYDVAQVNVPVTDAAFSKIGLTTAQVEQIQMMYPDQVNGLVVALKKGTPLSPAQQAMLNQVGGVSTTTWIPGYSSQQFSSELLANMGSGYDPNSGVF